MKDANKGCMRIELNATIIPTVIQNTRLCATYNIEDNWNRMRIVVVVTHCTGDCSLTYLFDVEMSTNFVYASILTMHLLLAVC
jgi:hypothetical protein